ncbi:hypothetical protein [Brevibacillus sp. FSL L8-0710]|uniref:hypothetical protein n=1 Tax=Brevibacillus sp. FSL L8-0710 TaxID=2975313 RepID=UPI0030FC743B
MNKFDAMFTEINERMEKMLKQLKLPGKYTLQNLKFLEKNLIPVVNTELFNDAARACVGYFLGETIIRNFKGAKWNKNCSKIEEISIDIPHLHDKRSKIRVHPFMTAYKFSIDSTKGLVSLFELIKVVRTLKPSGRNEQHSILIGNNQGAIISTSLENDELITKNNTEEHFYVETIQNIIGKK